MKIPVPEFVHIPAVVIPEIMPPNWTLLLAHMIKSKPALIAGAGVIDNSMASEIATQPSVEVSVIFINPEVISAALGV